MDDELSMMDRAFLQLTRTRLAIGALCAIFAAGGVVAWRSARPKTLGENEITFASPDTISPSAAASVDSRYPVATLAARPKLTLAAYDFPMPRSTPEATGEPRVNIKIGEPIRELGRLPTVTEATRARRTDDRLATVASRWSGADYESSWTPPSDPQWRDNTTPTDEQEPIFRLPGIDNIAPPIVRQPVEEVTNWQADEPQLVEQHIEATITPHVPADADAMRAVNQRAEEMIGNAFGLAQRNATYSARTELIAALRTITQAADMKTGTREHSEALRRGFMAIEEAEDFQQQGLADLNMQVLVAAHQTPVLKDADLDNVTPLVALQQYYTYAQEQLIIAGDEQPTASVALYGLGRLQADINGGDATAAPQAMVFHQAALMVDSMNYKAANELGVLLAKFGQYTQSRDMLVHSIRVVPQPESWRNLAKVHERLGEQQLAHKATYEGDLLARGGGGSVPVRWVEPAALAGTIGTSQPPMTATAPRSVEPSTSRNVSQGEGQGFMRFIPFMRRGQ